MKFLFLGSFVVLILLQSIVVLCLNQSGQISLPLEEKENAEKNSIRKIKEIVQPEFLKKKIVKVEGNAERPEEIVNMLSAVEKTPKMKISDMQTVISIKKDKSEGEVYEKVKFRLQDGIFNSVVRKISLGGTADRHFELRLASGDVTLTEARIVSNCMESTSLYEHPYICVISKFQSIDATLSPVDIEIEYEYTSENILRRREKPFSNTEQENVILWVYDNFNINTSIDNIHLTINIENDIDANRIITYPEKFLLKNQTDKGLSINWHVKDLKPGEFKNFALNIPIFNHSCKGVNEVHLEITTYSVMQFFIWIVVSILVIGLVSYVYIYKGVDMKENDETGSEVGCNKRYNKPEQEDSKEEEDEVENLGHDQGNTLKHKFNTYS